MCICLFVINILVVARALGGFDTLIYKKIGVQTSNSISLFLTKDKCFKWIFILLFVWICKEDILYPFTYPLSSVTNESYSVFFQLLQLLLDMSSVNFKKWKSVQKNN